MKGGAACDLVHADELEVVDSSAATRRSRADPPMLETGCAKRTPVGRYTVVALQMHGIPTGPALVERFRADLPAILADIEQLIRCESPSADLDAVARSAETVAEVGAALLGREPERIVLEGRTHLRWSFGGPAGVLVLGHHDTVWPLGSLRTHPFSIQDGLLRGPGCFDMKAGVVLALRAVAALSDRTGVTVLITGDEELGAPSSAQLIEVEARGRAAALVAEPAAASGALKIARKGISQYRIRAVGRAAHAGLEPERGINAAVELAYQMQVVARLGDLAVGTTVTPTTMTAGTTANTVPADGSLAVDVRTFDVAEQVRIDTALHALSPTLPGARLEVLGGPNRPPLAPSMSECLFRKAVRLGEQLAISPVTGAAVGGGSDGNFTAGVGTPTLDGLGAVGGGAHADNEHVLIDEFPARTALFTALLAEILGGAA